jgi:hypothetical protein
MSLPEPASIVAPVAVGHVAVPPGRGDTYNAGTASVYYRELSKTVAVNMIATFSNALSVAYQPRLKSSYVSAAPYMRVLLGLYGLNWCCPTA